MKGVVKQFKVEKESSSANQLPPKMEEPEPQLAPKDIPDQAEIKGDETEYVEPQKPNPETEKPIPATVKPEVLKRLQDVKSNRSPSIHIFYYPWYDSPEYINGTWKQWNHEYLPQWDKSDKHVYPTGRHIPPDDVGSWYYPSLGPYSSRDPLIVEQHMKWISSAGIDVIAVSWSPDKELNLQNCELSFIN